MIFALFANSKDAGDAVAALKEADIDDVSVVTRDNDGGVKTSDTEGPLGSDVMEGAAKGGAMGGLAGILAGLAAVAIPGVGPLFVAGPLAVSWGLTGATLGALTGGLVGALTDEGVPEEVAKGYEERIKTGDALVAVDTDGEVSKARKILEDHHAEEITMSKEE